MGYSLPGFSSKQQAQFNHIFNGEVQRLYSAPMFAPIRFLERQWNKIEPNIDKISGLKTACSHAVSAAANVKQLFSHLLEMGLFNDIFKGVGSVAGAFYKGGEGSSEVLVSLLDRSTRALRWISLLSIGSLPFTIYEIAKSTFYIIKGRVDRIDSALRVIKDIGGIFEGVAGLARGLAAVKVVAASSIAFAMPLSVIGAVLGSAGLAISLRSFVQTYRFSSEFDRISGWNGDGTVTEENFERIMSFLIIQADLEEKERAKKIYNLGKHFSFDGEALSQKLNGLKDSETLTLQQKNELVSCLRKRMLQKQISCGILFAASLVEFVAFPILLLSPFLCPPLLPLGFACVALGSVAAIVRFGVDWYTESRFEKKVDGFTCCQA